MHTFLTPLLSSTNYLTYLLCAYLPIYKRGNYSGLRPRRQSIEYRNFDHVGTNSAMTYVVLLSVKASTIERLWQTLDIGNMLGPNLGFNRVIL